MAPLQRAPPLLRGILHRPQVTDYVFVPFPIPTEVLNDTYHVRIVSRLHSVASFRRMALVFYAG